MDVGSFQTLPPNVLNRIKINSPFKTKRNWMIAGSISKAESNRTTYCLFWLLLLLFSAFDSLIRGISVLWWPAAAQLYILQKEPVAIAVKKLSAVFLFFVLIISFSSSVFTAERRNVRRRGVPPECFSLLLIAKLRTHKKCGPGKYEVSKNKNPATTKKNVFIF